METAFLLWRPLWRGYHLFGAFPEKMSYYVSYDFEALKSLWKNLGNFQDHSRKETMSSTVPLMNIYIIKGKPFTNLTVYVLISVFKFKRRFWGFTVCNIMNLYYAGIFLIIYSFLYWGFSHVNKLRRHHSLNIFNNSSK